MFTVVIPLYNKELSIQATIQSVLNQTCQNFEIVVINDGSTDSSAKIVETIKDRRIRLICQVNQGVSAARNYGIKEAKNEWIAFLDGDDLWNPNHLEEIIRMMSKFPDESFYVTSFEYSDNRVLFKHPREESIFKINNYFKEAIKETLIWTSTVVINRQCFNKLGCFNINLNRGEDLDMWARLVKEYTVVKSSVSTAIYRIEAENRTGLSKNIETTHVYYINLESILDENEKDYYRNIILNRLYAYGRSRDVTNLIKLKYRHSSITWSDYLRFIIYFVRKRVVEVSKLY